ncbi:MAG: CD1247 N-terminal domain-containing protein [Bacteroidota bacterium]
MNAAEEKLEALELLVREQILPPDGPDRLAWEALLDLCRELAGGLTDLAEAHDDLSLYVETLDEDLVKLEEQIFGSMEEEDGDETSVLDAIRAPGVRGPHPEPMKR